MLRIEELLGRKPRALSGGPRQRVAIGRAVVRNPKAFLLDEPLSNLDAELRVIMRFELSSLHNRLNATMIYVTHDQVEAMTLADKIVVLNDGMVEQTGPPLELYSHPANLFVAGFIGSPKMNFFDVRVSDLKEGEIRLAFPQRTIIISNITDKCRPGQQVTLGIRPEHIVLKKEPSDNSLPAKVTLTERLGGESYIFCLLEDEKSVIVHEPDQTRLQKGDIVHLHLPAEKVHLFNDRKYSLLNK